MPGVGVLRRTAREVVPWWSKRFGSSASYWPRRYAFGGDSGSGSRGQHAYYKADYVNVFCRRHSVRSVLDIGCGDGQVACLLDVPDYLGTDIAPHAILRAQKRCPGKRFMHIRDLRPADRADVVLSLDVVYHLVEDDIYRAHLRFIRDAAKRWLIVYSTDYVSMPHPKAPHVRHRMLIADIESDTPSTWRLLHRGPNPLYGDAWRERPHFLVFERRS